MADIVTDYMDGFEYKNNTIERIHHAEGVITQRTLRTGESTEFVGAGGLVWQYEYTLKDHLGNTRVTFADLDGSRTIEPNTEINQINHYYPFGLNMEGNWNGASADAKNKYQYNDKELQTDFGLNLNDYGARFYDAAIGKFTTQDRFSEMYNHMTPYQYAANNPIKYIDVNGDSIPSYFYDEKGKELSSVPVEIQQSYACEKGIDVSYNAATHMMYAAGDAQTDNPLVRGVRKFLSFTSEYLVRTSSKVYLKTKCRSSRFFRVPKTTALASICDAMRTIYCVFDARKLLYVFSQVL